MDRIKQSINQPFVVPWAERIGKIILNFSGIEFSSYMWLVQLSENPDLIDSFTKMHFSKRVEKIKSLITERSCNDNWETESNSYWDIALDLATKRNRMAHNPLMFGWTNGIETGEPDFIGIMNMKKNNEGLEEPILKKDLIDEYINKIVEVAKKLDLLLEEWCSIRDKN
jgi:hypothetical protein